MNPDDLQYTKEHEWLRVRGDTATIGITEHAQEELGEVVYVELPSVGDRFDANESFGTVESVKAVSELFMPLAGEVVRVNDALDGSPELVNDDAYGKGWMIEVRLRESANTDELLSAVDYSSYIAGQGPEA